MRNLVALGETDIVLYRTHKATLPDDELAGYPVETDLTGALRTHKPDAVIISNPTSMHLDVAIPAAEAGCAILLEKPIAGLLPPVGDGADLRAVATILLRFPWQSLLAGTDVALRALAPRLRLRPGVVRCDVGLPPGALRTAFAGFASLLPGTLPVATLDDVALPVHCLDVAAPVERPMAAEAARFARALGRTPADG